MRVRVEIDSKVAEPEVVIRTNDYTEQVKKLQKIIEEDFAKEKKILFYKDTTELYLPLDEVLFFETEERAVVAHVTNDAYEVHEHLYQLETELPAEFVRISKSTIVNVSKILSLNRSLSNCLIQFYDSYKQVYASRRYYKELTERLGKLR